MQVNCSGEKTKHGLAPDTVQTVVSEILQTMPSLLIKGLMTIGSAERSLEANQAGINADFACLTQLRGRIQQMFPYQLELSMGMSADYEVAIQMGSTNIRVGSAIFGER